MLFENIYASGFRTDQGLVAILSGFPAQPNVSIIWNTEKQEHLPVLTPLLKGAGYFTTLIYAGDILFSNMKAYVVHNGFEIKFEKKVGSLRKIDISSLPQPIFE